MSLFNLFRKNDASHGTARYWESRAKSAEAMLQRQIGLTDNARANAANRKLEMQQLQKACGRKSRRLRILQGDVAYLTRHVEEMHKLLEALGHPEFAILAPVRQNPAEPPKDSEGNYSFAIDPNGEVRPVDFTVGAGSGEVEPASAWGVDDIAGQR